MTSAKELPLFVRDMLASPPRAGEGVNLYLYRVARVLHPYRGGCEIAGILRAITAGCGRVVTEKEISRAIENSKAAAWTPGEPVSFILQPAWPKVNAEQHEAVIAAMGMGLADLREVSRMSFEDNEPQTEEIIDVLFPDNPLLCGGRAIRSLLRARLRIGEASWRQCSSSCRVR